MFNKISQLKKLFPDVNSIIIDFSIIIDSIEWQKLYPVTYVRYNCSRKFLAASSLVKLIIFDSTLIF